MDKMRLLYFDCFSGVSGNMILGAMISAGLDVELLKTELKKLNLPDLDLSIERVNRSGISSVHVSVMAPDQKKHRHLPEINKIIGESRLDLSVKQRAMAIFRRLAEAEAAVHGVPVEKIHFHEVGALDAIADIVGAAVALEIIRPDKVVSSPINVGSGTVKIDHGHFPVPPPAVAELVRGVPIYSDGPVAELATPTGAAIITTVANSYGVLPKITPKQIGYGAGTRDFKGFPNVLRVLIGDADSTELEERVEHLVLMETNIDDLSPQSLGLIMERALSAGALDCWFTPAQMKKNRPAIMVSILARPEDEQRMRELLYRETTTIGIRRSLIERHSLGRSVTEVQTEYGPVRVKKAILNGETVNVHPEFEDVKKASESTGADFASIAEAAVRGAADCK